MFKEGEVDASPEFEAGGGSARAQKKGWDRRWLILPGVGGLIILCVCIIGLGALALQIRRDGGDATTVTEEEADTGVAEETEIAEEAPDTPAAPTEEPAPTDTPAPTATVEPTPLEPGTYLVGTDIQPGLYYGEPRRGGASPCIATRLSDLSGEFTAMIASSFGYGVFYLEVLEGDHALTTDCPSMTYLSALPEPVETFPTILVPGDYLVGITMQPGSYRGEGTESGPPCIWERLSGFSGDDNATVANGSETGPFVVEVQTSDFGFRTYCELTLEEQKPIDATLELVDGRSNRAQLPLSHFSLLQPPLPVRLGKADFMNFLPLAAIMYQTFEFPLAAFVAVNPEFEPQTLSGVPFIFERTAAGVVVLDEA